MCEQNLINDLFKVMEWLNICDVYEDSIGEKEEARLNKKVQLKI